MNGITVGEKIKQLRTRKGLLQSDLADHLSVTNGAISNWETNRRLPSIEELKKICLFFDVPLDYFAESPNFEFSEEHVQYHRSPKMASVTIRHLGPCCEDCTYLIGAALMLFLEWHVFRAGSNLPVVLRIVFDSGPFDFHIDPKRRQPSIVD